LSHLLSKPFSLFNRLLFQTLATKNAGVKCSGPQGVPWTFPGPGILSKSFLEIRNRFGVTTTELRQGDTEVQQEKTEGE
jgi:hypothetical protein